MKIWGCFKGTLSFQEAVWRSRVSNRRAWTQDQKLKCWASNYYIKAIINIAILPRPVKSFRGEGMKTSGPIEDDIFLWKDWERESEAYQWSWWGPYS